VGPSPTQGVLVLEPHGGRASTRDGRLVELRGGVYPTPHDCFVQSVDGREGLGIGNSFTCHLAAPALRACAGTVVCHYGSHYGR
jgi:hypothetical protein